MSDYVTIHGNTWKWADVQEMVDWARQQSWTRQKWKSDTETHDHCQICWWALSDALAPEEGEGYTTDTNRWLCLECYEQFIKEEA